MARCQHQLVIGLIVAHLCLSALAYGGFEYDPRLVPQAQAYAPQPNYQPQPPYNYYQQQPLQYYPGSEPQAAPYYPNYEQPGMMAQAQPYPDYNTDLLENGEYAMQEASTAASAPAANTGAGGPVVQTPDQTADSTASSSPSTPAANSNMDALDIQLAAALEAVKADMISKGKQVLEEKDWTDQVKAVIDQYTKKISNVYINIEKLKKDMGDLYKKKQQIINAQIQKSLTAKLQDSKSDLQTVQAALDKVSNTQAEFEQSKKDIQSTIDSIFAQLAELKGQPAPAAGAAGGDSSATPASGSASTPAAAAAQPAAASSSDSSSTDSSSSDTSNTDIVDKTAEINSKIDTIKSIVSALNKGASSSSS